MTKPDTKADEGRRNFLKLAAMSAPAAAAGTVAATGNAEAATVEDEGGTGLRKTAHVQAYLDSARF